MNLEPFNIVHFGQLDRVAVRCVDCGCYESTLAPFGMTPALFKARFPGWSVNGVGESRITRCPSCQKKSLLERESVLKSLYPEKSDGVRKSEPA